MLVAGAGPGSEAVLFLNGKSDGCETVRPDDFDQLQKASAGGRCRLVELGVGTQRDFLWFNQNTGANAAGKPVVNPVKLKWFRNKQFRQAISCAIDRDPLARAVYSGRAQPIYWFIYRHNQKWYQPA